MKKVINGKVYDTKTAERVAEWDNDYPVNDFHHVDEELYRKKTGEYFLYGSGGPLSQYAEWHGNSGSGGERIIPLTYEEATKWAEEKLDGDDYENISGKYPKTKAKSKSLFTYRVPRLTSSARTLTKPVYHSRNTLTKLFPRCD